MCNSPKREVHQGSSGLEPMSFEVPVKTQMELSERQAAGYLDLELTVQKAFGRPKCCR